MFLQRPSRASIRKLSAALALVTAMQPVMSVAWAAPMTARSAAVLRQATQPAQGAAVSMAGALFNGVVRQAFESQGWQVSALSDSLDWSAVQIGSSGITGSGAWQVDAIDEAGGAAHVEGDLAFDIQSEAQTSNGLAEISSPDALVGSTHVFTGTFKSEDTALDFAAHLSSSGSGGNVTTEARYDVSLTRGGATSRAIATSHGIIEKPAYGFTRATTKGTVERDGKTEEWTNVTTTRSFGKGESEIWQELDTPQGSAGPSHVTEHSFQRVVGNNVSQYVDRFDLTRDGKTYRLESPGSVTGTLDGSLNSGLTLVDSGGARLEPARNGARYPGLSSPLQQTLTTGVPLSPEEAGLLLTLMVGGFLIMGGGAAGILFLGGSLSGLSGSLFLGGGIFAAGLGSAGIIRSVNGDPYFVIADMRPNSDPIGESGVQITRVAGGIVASPPSSAGGLAAGASPSASLAASTAPGDQPYDDDPVPFVGGTLPKGAQAIGEWVWDGAHAYGAVPTHTQSTSDGPQMHYFLHASSPLKLGPDSNIVQYVYLDPSNPPTELYMQFYTGKGDGEHRAYWGDNRVQTGGKEGTASLLPMGSLPPAGGWVRLSVPAGKVGLAGGEVNGVLYGLYGGKAWWGPTTTSSHLLDNSASAETLEAPPVVLTSTPGAQIAYRLAGPMNLSIEIADAGGKMVRHLQDGTGETAAGYHVTTWDAKGDDGTPVQDAPYTVRFLSGGSAVAERPITISPLVANILTPGPFSLVRGDQVPVIAEAYGERFGSYTLEYGEGISPTTWYTLTESSSPTLLPTGRELKQFNPGNLANWNVGVNEFKPWHDEGLNGVYTVRLRVAGIEGQQASDTVTVIVGRLAHTAEGGVIASPGGEARLLVPALATTEPFSLMALVPAEQLQPDDGQRASLPTDATLAGGLYELFPAGERFRRPATLELPYKGNEDPTHVGIMLGDGTPGGWRYIGGKYDAQRGVVSVPILGFGAGRALVGVFTSAGFGPHPADPTANARVQIAPADAAPLVTADAPPGVDNTFAFYSDLESSGEEWESLDISGTLLSRVRGADAGVAENDSVLKVTRLAGGVRLVRVRSTPFSAARYPLISFDYRMPDDYVPDLFVRSGGIWWQISLGASVPIDTEYFKHVDAPKLDNDGEWHHYTADLHALLLKAGAEPSPMQIDEIVLGRFEKQAYMQVAAVDSGSVGSAYYVDNFAALAPTNAGTLHMSWTAPPGTSFSAYAAALVADGDTFSPADSEAGADTSADAPLPPNMPDGLYYYHVAGKKAGGAWSAATLLPVLLDRTAPTAGSASLAAGPGVESLIQIPLSDSNGVDPGSLRLRLGNQTYGLGRGLTYDPLLGSVEVVPSSLEPAVPPAKGGAQVEITLLEAADRAGNKLAAPITWSSLVDSTQGKSDAPFRKLTVKGGSSPAVSPDGQTVAFISSRGGSPKVWLMQADDYEEKAASAKPLTGIGGGGDEGSPAWSPDGAALAFVSDASGSPQVWLAAVDGSGARALTTGDGGAASPAWLADGSRIVFVRSGNLWSVGPDGNDMQPVTRYPERPIMSVSAQPGPGGQLLAVGFKLYQETVEIYDLATGELSPLTEGGRDREPAWSDEGTILFAAPSGTQNGSDRQDAIWQVSAYGGKPEPLDSSAPPGISASQPSTASGTAGRDLLAIVSNRDGSSDIWVRQGGQVGRLEVSPAAGAAPGEATDISYVLPQEAGVTLRVLDGGGTAVRSLLAGESRQAGPQRAAWDGLDEQGQAVPPGDYTVSLEAQTAAGGASIARYATARRVDATGTLQLSVEQWAGQPADSGAGLRVAVYPAGVRTRPVAVTTANAAPSFDVAVGRYDAVVEYGGIRHEVRGIAVEAGGTAQVTVDLGLGGLQPALVSGQGQPFAASASISVSMAGDPNALPLQTRYSTDAGFALPPGSYDVRVQYGSISAVVRDVRVARGEVAQPQINLNSGLILVQVDARDGEPAETGGRLLVQAVDPRDHSKVVASDYLSNPSQLPLPEGTYDLRVEYGTASPGQEGEVFGTLAKWITGVQVRSGETITESLNLKLTPVEISLLDAPGKPAPSGAVAFRLSPVGEPGLTLASVLTATARLELPQGEYSIVADYKSTDLKNAGPLGETVTVEYGRPEVHEISLGMGHIAVDVQDEQGKPVAADGISALAYAAGQRDTPFAIASGANPLEMTVRAGEAYDVVVRLDDGRSAVLSGQQVTGGGTLALKVAQQDFK